jgi:hypothetical protein
MRTIRMYRPSKEGASGGVQRRSKRCRPVGYKLLTQE